MLITQNPFRRFLCTHWLPAAPDLSQDPYLLFLDGLPSFFRTVCRVINCCSWASPKMSMLLLTSNGRWTENKFLRSKRISSSPWWCHRIISSQARVADSHQPNSRSFVGDLFFFGGFQSFSLIWTTTCLEFFVWFYSSRDWPEASVGHSVDMLR